MSRETTFAAVLHRAAAELAAVSDEARLEVEILLAHATGTNRAGVLARLPDQFDADLLARFDALLARRMKREPLAYILGRREFYGIEFAVTPEVLIPRPETEMLVGFALDEVGRRGDDLRIVDVGTGSGAIAVAVAAHATGTRIIATDDSVGALDVARANARVVGVEGRVEFKHADLLGGVSPVDVVLANLPYVAEAEWATLAPEVRDHEPRSALVGGVRGTEVIERLLEVAPMHLRTGGAFALEIGATQGLRLMAVARERFPEADVSVIKDFGGLDRMVVVRTVGG